jgi:hypothetical protein
MFRKLRPRSVYDVMAAIACFGVLAGGTAYAVDTVGSADVINNSLLSEDIHNPGIRSMDMANDSVPSRAVIDESLLGTDVLNGSLSGADVAADSLTGSDVAPSSLTGSDVASSSLTGSDVATNSLTGSDVLESSLNVAAMGCQIGKIQGYARVKGSSGIPSFYTDASEAVDTRHNCSGGTVQVRRSAEGVFFVRFNGVSARLAVAISNSDGFGTQSTATDNVLSVNRITGGADVGAFRVEIEDINSDGSDPQDNWFTIVVV